LIIKIMLLALKINQLILTISLKFSTTFQTITELIILLLTSNVYQNKIIIIEMIYFNLFDNQYLALIN
jgi:hypothetical protein